jgi:hypothetical protein
LICKEQDTALFFFFLYGDLQIDVDGTFLGLFFIEYYYQLGRHGIIIETQNTKYK